MNGPTLGQRVKRFLDMASCGHSDGGMPGVRCRAFIARLELRSGSVSPLARLNGDAARVVGNEHGATLAYRLLRGICLWQRQ